MALSAESYLQTLQALLLRGKAWTRESGSRMTQLLTAIAQEFARVDLRTDDMLDEADLRTTSELLTDWERAAGLPDPCAAEQDTVELRRQVLIYKLTNVGGQSKQFYIDVAARLGYTVTITEFKKHTVASRVNDPINGVDWVFTWRINAPQATVRRAKVTSRVNEPLASWGNQILECNITRLKPAHTHVQFAYA